MDLNGGYPTPFLSVSVSAFLLWEQTKRDINSIKKFTDKNGQKQTKTDMNSTINLTDKNKNFNFFLFTEIYCNK